MRFDRQFGAIFTGLAAIVTASSPVVADGLPAPKRSAPAYEAPAPAEPARGPCYVRADIGYGWSADDSGRATITVPRYPTTTGNLLRSHLDDSSFGEFGFGCGFNRQSMVGGSLKDPGHEISTPTGLRGDITYGFHANRAFSGVPVNPGPLPGVRPPPADSVTATVRSSTLMFNLYYDLATMHGLTPYVGAGLGVAFVDLKRATFNGGTVGSIGTTDDTNLAWSLMAGVSTDIGRGMVLDVGYRYLNIDGIALNNAAVNYGFKINDLSEHQIKAGIRIPLH